jgi:hypothetical protein
LGVEHGNEIVVFVRERYLPMLGTMVARDGMVLTYAVESNIG